MFGGGLQRLRGPGANKRKLILLASRFPLVVRAGAKMENGDEMAAFRGPAEIVLTAVDSCLALYVTAVTVVMCVYIASLTISVVMCVPARITPNPPAELANLNNLLLLLMRFLPPQTIAKVNSNKRKQKGNNSLVMYLRKFIYATPALRQPPSIYVKHPAQNRPLPPPIAQTSPSNLCLSKISMASPNDHFVQSLSA